MKRSPLKSRSVPLSRGAGPKRGKARRWSSMATFWEQVTDHGTKRCALEGLRNCDYWPTGTADAHHYLPKRNLTDEQAQDARVGVPLCRFHHAQVEAARVVCPRPPELDGFLTDFNLTERKAA